MAFVLLAFIAQVAFLVAARSSAQAAVDSFARRAAISGTGESDDLVAELRSALPGAAGTEATVVRSHGAVIAEVRFDWDPPGPHIIPVQIRARGIAPIVPPP